MQSIRSTFYQLSGRSFGYAECSFALVAGVPCDALPEFGEKKTKIC